MMEKLINFIYKASRKVFNILSIKRLNYSCDNPEEIAHKIYDLLDSNEPCMIARLGAFEIHTIANAIGVKKGRPSLLSYVRGDSYDWKWDERLLQYMESNAGFFPATHENAMKFADMMIEDAKEVDMLGCWQEKEKALTGQLKDAYKFPLRMLEPYWNEFKWTTAFKGKRILVIHPFAELIKSQYKKRESLFEDRNIMPEFESLDVIKAVQSAGGSDEYSDWFQALDYMKSEIDKLNFDICLIACGAYGFPLAAYVKRIGKKAIVWGGSLQLYFGIMGRRWRHEEPFYSDGRLIGLRLIKTDSWVNPGENERPKNYKQIENGCYW